MDLTIFKLDIDELINEFAEHCSTTLADMKMIWLSRKFTFIYESKPTSNVAFFMQSLFAHSISYMLSTSSLSHRLGGLYCLYCLYETQPFKPPFKIYLSLGELRRLRSLVVEAKEEQIRVVPALVKRMLEQNVFLFGSVEVNDNSINERISEVTKLQNTRMEVAYEKLLANTPIERYLHMDLDMDFDLKLLRKCSTEYAAAKEHAINEAGKVVDIENIKHMAENKKSLGDVMTKLVEDWNTQKDVFYEQTGVNKPSSENGKTVVCYQEDGLNQSHIEEDEDEAEIDEYGKELELLLS